MLFIIQFTGYINARNCTESSSWLNSCGKGLDAALLFNLLNAPNNWWFVETKTCQGTSMMYQHNSLLIWQHAEKWFGCIFDVSVIYGRYISDTRIYLLPIIIFLKYWGRIFSLSVTWYYALFYWYLGCEQLCDCMIFSEVRAYIFV